MTGESDRNHKIRHNGDTIKGLFVDLFLDAHFACVRLDNLWRLASHDTELARAICGSLR